MNVEHELHSIGADAGVKVWLHAEQLGPHPQVVSLQGDEPVATASLYKLPLALAWADLVEAGQVDPLTPLAMPARDRTRGPTGVSMLWDDVTLSLRDVVRLMLAVSDNTCADALIEHLGIDRINDRLHQRGISHTVIRRGSAASIQKVMRDTGSSTPGEAEALLADPDHARETSQYDSALASATTAAECCGILRRLWEAQTPAHVCVRDAMAHQAWRHRIGSGFPHDDVDVRGKTGTLVRLRHEAAVVTFPHEYPIAVTVLTRAVRSERHLPRVDAAIGQLARVAATSLRRAR